MEDKKIGDYDKKETLMFKPGEGTDFNPQDRPLGRQSLASDDTNEIGRDVEGFGSQKTSIKFANGAGRKGRRP